ncbi:MAG: P-II family nitrogen regulator [Thermotogaceae bacterium]|jgi:nitrogen regulatory protein PII|nr:P-II family nitrogen regulator [Thermotogaceae bacterium]
MDVIAIFAVVERGKADHLVEKAKKAGAKGATILYGRGTTAENDIKHFLSFHVESSKEVIIILAEKEHVEAIQKALIEAGRLDEPGTGILFSVPVLHLTGLKHLGLP